MATRMRVQRTKNDQYILTIPKALVEALSIDKGTEAEFKINGKNELRIIISNEKKRE
jgi:antitoxin component of MazEF toxin-antitoxin module